MLVSSHNIANVRQGLTLLLSFGSEYLCRYLKLDGTSIVLRDTRKFSDPLLTQRVMIETIKCEPMWRDLYENGAFESMEFRALGEMLIEDLSESEKDLCVRMAKEMIRVSAGEFMMGALYADEYLKTTWALEERPRNKVTLTRDFLMSKYAVTQALWESVIGSNPSKFKGANRPVETVSWFDCVLFCNKLSVMEDLEPVYTIKGCDEFDDVDPDWTANGYRLPTEEEWQYSAQANQRYKYSGSDNVDEVAWFGEGWNSCSTHPVGQKKPNGFGFYDMSGNVDEYVWGWEYLQDDEYLVIRGGSVSHCVSYDRGRPEYLNVEQRSYLYSEEIFKSNTLGFRICRNV